MNTLATVVAGGHRLPVPALHLKKKVEMECPHVASWEVTQVARKFKSFWPSLKCNK